MDQINLEYETWEMSFAVRVCSDVNIFNFILSFIPEISAFNYFHQLVRAGNFNLGLSYIFPA